MTDRIPTMEELAAMPLEELRALAKRIGVTSADVATVTDAIARAAWATRGQPDADAAVDAAIRGELEAFTGRRFDARLAALRSAAETMEAVCIGPGLLEVRALQDGKPVRSRYFTDALKAAVWALERGDDGANVYFGIARRLERKGDAGASPYVGAVTVDVDAKGGVTIADLLEHVSDWQPSIVVHSGGGLHCYWLLQEPAPAAVVAALNRAACRSTGGDPGREGSSAALLRVPGTRNGKPEAAGAIVTVLQSSGRRYDLDELAALFDAAHALDARDTTPARYPDQPDLLGRVAAHAQGLTRGHDGRLRFRCLFSGDHKRGDATPSAVLFPNGWYHCACSSSAPSIWTKRPEVRALGVAPLVVRAPSGRMFRVPRAGLETAGNLAGVLTPAQRAALEMRRGAPSLFDAAGRAAVFDDPEVFAPYLRQRCYPLGYRLFWATCALLQETQERNAHVAPADRCGPGEFPLRLDAIAELFGEERTATGQYSGRFRGDVKKAIAALESFWPTIQWSPKTTPYTGPLLAKVGSIGSPTRRGVVWRYRLHDGVWKHWTGASRAWFLAPRESLRLDADSLAIYLHARAALVRLRDSGGDAKPMDARLSLPALAQRAGVAIPVSEWQDHPGRILGRYAKAYAAVPGLGVTVDLQAPPEAALCVTMSVPVRALSVPDLAEPIAQARGTKRLPGSHRR